MFEIILEKITPRFLVDAIRLNKKKNLLKKYQGNNVTCPICLHNLCKFGNYGYPVRFNAFCYNCDSLERHRLMWLFITKKIGILNENKKIKLLHFSPERVLYNLFNSSPNIDYTSCDLFPQYYNFDGKNKVEKVDITKIPYADNTYDFIICNHVLEHIIEDRLAMSELKRILKTGGQAIL